MTSVALDGGMPVSTSEQSQIRTRMFARALGPFFVIVPAIIAVRASSQLATLFTEFTRDPLWQWVLGAVLLFWGSVIISFHQYWRSAAAIIISLLGWFLAVRGVLILAFPDTFNSIGGTLGEDAITMARAFFIGLALAGLYLTFVGWIARPTDANHRP